jgi:hypothetical protein
MNAARFLAFSIAVSIAVTIACGPQAKPAPIANSEAAESSTETGTKPAIGGGGDDRDGDGIRDDVDQCPDDPEDFDGFADDDGCPEPDNDGDGILDVDDLCPNEPEVMNGQADDDGCPP